MPYKIRTKLIIAFLAIIFPFIIITGIIAFYNVSNTRKANLKADATREEMHLVMSLQIALDRALMPGNDYIITGDKKYIDEFNEVSKNAEDLIKNVEETLTILKGMDTPDRGIRGQVPEISDETKVLAFVKTAWTNIKEISQKIFAIQNPAGNKEAATLMEEMDYTWAYPAISMLDKHHEIDRKEGEKALEEVNRAWRLAWVIMAGGGSMLVVAGVFFAFFYSRLFTTPIKAIHNGADEIARGNFKARLDIKTGDEIEQLSNSMNEMAAQLDSFTSNLQGMVAERTRELQYERDKLIKVFEAMADGVYIVNQQYDIEYLNPVLLKEFGSIEGRKCYTYFHDRTDICPWCPNQRVFAGETVHWEWASFKNGKTYDLLDTPFRQPDGSNWKLEIFRDITEKKKVEEALYKSAELLKLQINRMPFGYIVWDTSFRVMSWNPAAERIFGFTSEEAKGKHPYDLIVPKEAQPHVDKIWHRLLEGDTTAHSINENLTKDGRIIICEWTNTPLRYHNGDIIGVLSMVQDITERKKAEEAIQESETRFRGVVETTKDAIICIREKGTIYLWNKSAEEMFGYSADEAMAKDIHALIVPERFREQADEGFKTFLQTGTCPVIGKTIELIGLRKDGTEFPVELAVSAMNIKGTWHAVGIIRDITERKKAEEKLREQLDELLRFQKATVNREFRIKELRGRVKELEEELKRLKG